MKLIAVRINIATAPITKIDILFVCRLIILTKMTPPNTNLDKSSVYLLASIKVAFFNFRLWKNEYKIVCDLIGLTGRDFITLFIAYCFDC